MRTSPFAFILIAFLLVGIAIADDPPSLNNFHQFFGSVENLPAGGGYKVKATLNGEDYTTNIASDLTYGYSPVFKVFGSSGEINFYILDSLNREQSITTVPFTACGITNLNLNYAEQSSTPVSNTPANTTTTSSNTSSSSSSSNPGRNSPPRNVTIPAGSCAQNWECGLWGDCSNSQQTRVCYRLDQCDQQLASGEVGQVMTIPKPNEQQS